MPAATVTFQRVPVMENLGLALLGIGYAVLAEQQWKPYEERLSRLYERWIPRLKNAGDWPQEIHDARAALEDAYRYAHQSVIFPVAMYIMRLEVFAMCEVPE